MRQLFFFYLSLGLPWYVKAAKIELYGINYSTRQGSDWDPNRCKPRATVLNDLKLLQTITSRIRIYSLVDCNQGFMVVSIAKELGMQVWLGLWVNNLSETFEAEHQALKNMMSQGLMNDETVLGVHVGNDAIGKEVSAATAIDNLESIRQTLKSKGPRTFPFYLPLTIADTIQTYKAHSSILAVVDVVSLNAFPFWEKQDAESAVDFLLAQVSKIETAAIASNKSLLFSETGWSNSGFDVRTSPATPENQITYFKDFYCKITSQTDWDTFYFQGIDSAWRTLMKGEENGVEGHFGIFTADLTMKPQFKSLAFTCPESMSPNTVYSFSDTALDTVSTKDKLVVNNAKGDGDGFFSGVKRSHPGMAIECVIITWVLLARIC